MTSIQRADFMRSFRGGSLDELAGRAPSLDRARLARADLNGDGVIGNTARERARVWTEVDRLDHDGDRGSVGSRRGQGFDAARALAPGVRTAADRSGPSVTLGEVVATHVDGVPDVSRERTHVGGRWDSGRILDRLGQYDNTTAPSTQASRCGAATVLAGAITEGPEATARFADRLATRTGGADGATAREIAGRVRGGTSTLGDMHQLQDIAYRSYRSSDRTSLTVGQLGAMERGLRGHDGGASEMSTVQGTRERIAGLHNGESFTMLLSRDAADTNQRDGHYVRVGRDDRGREYVYDPAVRDGHHVIYRDADPAAFRRYTEERTTGTSPRLVSGRDGAFEQAERAGLLDRDPTDPAVARRLRALGIELREQPANPVIP